MKRAVFLDRDGVINRVRVRDGKPYPPDTLAEFELLPGVEWTIRALRKAGFLIIVVTNQPDVATGVQRRNVVESMHDKLRAMGLCDDIKVCYHADADDCECRKPNTGLVLAAQEKYNLDLSRCYIIGDREGDIQLGKRLGMISMLVKTGRKESSEHEWTEAPDFVFPDLELAVHHILNQERQ